MRRLRQVLRKLKKPTKLLATQINALLTINSVMLAWTSKTLEWEVAVLAGSAVLLMHLVIFLVIFLETNRAEVDLEVFSEEQTYVTI